MPTKRLHIVAFDIPWPANYGGAIEVFYKIKALHDIGVQLVLHCFEYGGRTPNTELSQLCERVFYYPRSRTLLGQMSLTPFIIATRKHPELLKNLLADDAPILFEGLHTCGFLNHPSLKDRRKAVRVHNIEWEYYRDLAASATNFVERMYFHIEHLKLKRIEAKLLLSADVLFPLSSSDAARIDHPNKHIIPVFHPNDAPKTTLGSGQFILFHGRLSVADNQRVAIMLAEIANETGLPITIAGGGDIPNRLLDLLHDAPSISFVHNPDQNQMHSLMHEAAVHVVWSFQSSGVKLKTINALLNGQHIVANSHALAGLDIELPCHRVETKAELSDLLKVLINQPFLVSALEYRRANIDAYFDNNTNATLLMPALLT